MKLFMMGVRKMPVFWQAWLGVLILINGVGPLFFLSKNVAVVTLVAMIIGAVIGVVLTRVQGFTKLLGLMHGPWVPMFALQILVLVNQDPTGNFRTWLITSATVTLVSLVIDIVDVISYMKGNNSNLIAE